MNVGIDFDNTITANPKFFKELVNDLLSSGRNLIYIISSCAKEDEPTLSEIRTRKSLQLNEWGIPFERLELALEPIPENKAFLCESHGIGLMIDDDLRNLEAIMKRDPSIVCVQFFPPNGDEGR
jgi:hypothetical protein